MSLGAHCERVDEQIFQGSILDRIYNQIAKADIIISDLSGRNPNVFYETGYAHALGSTVILVTQNKEDIPFDLMHYPHVIYGGKIGMLRTELEKRIRWCIENPTRALARLDVPIALYLNKVPLDDNPEIPTVWTEQQRYENRSVQKLNARILIHNAGRRVVMPNQLDVCILSSDLFFSVDEEAIETLELPGERVMHRILTKVGPLFRGHMA